MRSTEKGPAAISSAQLKGFADPATEDALQFGGRRKQKSKISTSQPNDLHVFPLQSECNPRRSVSHPKKMAIFVFVFFCEDDA